MRISGAYQHLLLQMALSFWCMSIVAPELYAGGENRAGTNAASELLIPVGARDIALAGSSIATSSGLDALYWNPAGLVRTEHPTNAMFSHMSYIADIGIDYVAVSTSFEGFGALGFSIKSVGVGEIMVTTEDQPDGTGQTINPTLLNIGLTYSRFVTDRISIGASATLISERFGLVAATGVAFSAGVQYSGIADVSGLSVGVAVKNLGPRMAFDGDGLIRQGIVSTASGSFYKVDAESFDLPATIEIGFAYNHAFVENNSVTITGLFQNNNFSADEYKVGVEYGYAGTLFLRGGYTFSDITKSAAIQADDGTDRSIRIFGFSAGAGVRYPVGGLDVSFDYAYRAVRFLENNHVFTVGVGL